jgi:hypothetical protein
MSSRNGPPRVSLPSPTALSSCAGIAPAPTVGFKEGLRPTTTSPRRNWGCLLFTAKTDRSNTFLVAQTSSAKDRSGLNDPRGCQRAAPAAPPLQGGGGGDLVPSPSSGLALLSLSLSARWPPNFLGLRRSTHFGLACGAEDRKQSKQIGDYPLQGGRVI